MIVLNNFEQTGLIVLVGMRKQNLAAQDLHDLYALRFFVRPRNVQG